MSSHSTDNVVILTEIYNSNKLAVVFQYALIYISEAETGVEFEFKEQNQAKLD
jgi:hypothetical protein